MKYHFYNIQGLRGIAVLLVVFFHLTGIQIKNSSLYALPEILQFGAVGVDIFFLISGFLMMAITRDAQANIKTSIHFMIRRLIRIFPMYWIVSLPIIFLLFFASRETLSTLKLNPDAARSIPELPFYLLKSMLLFPQVNLPPLTISWTLIHEIFFYCVFGFLLLLPAITHRYLLIVWSALTVFFWFFLRPTQYQPISYLLCNPLTLEFATGALLATLLPYRKRVSNPVIVLILGCLAAAGSWLIWTAQYSYEFPIAGDRVLYFLLPCALVLIGCVCMEDKGQLLPLSLQKIGDASYSLYLTHIIFLSLGRKLWQFYDKPDTLLINLLFWPVLFVVTIALGMLCYRWIEKPLLQACRKITAA